MKRSQQRKAVVGVVPKSRFTSDNFAYYLKLNLSPGMIPPPEGNFGVTLGSSGMLFEVGSMGNAAAQLNAMYGPAVKNITATPD